MLEDVGCDCEVAAPESGPVSAVAALLGCSDGGRGGLIVKGMGCVDCASSCADLPVSDASLDDGLGVWRCLVGRRCSFAGVNACYVCDSVAL